MADKVKRLLDLIAQLPKGITADWRGTNHFWLYVDPPPEYPWQYWWFSAQEFRDRTLFSDRRDEGRRLGLLLDLAEAAKAAEEELRALTEAE